MWTEAYLVTLRNFKFYCEKVDDLKTVFKNKGAAEAELARLQPELDSQDETLHSEIFEGEYGPDEPGYPYNQSDYC